MKITRREVLAGAAVLAVTPAWSQSGTMTLVVPFPPGGSTDALARLLQAPLQAKLNRVVIVENKSGAFVGLANFAEYFASPAFSRSAGNTLTFAALTTLLTVPLAFTFAYAIQRSCIGAKWLWRNIALNVIASWIVEVTFVFADAILVEAAMSFIGAGIPQPTPTWGNMLYDSRTYIYNASWMTLFPGLALACTVPLSALRRVALSRRYQRSS